MDITSDTNNWDIWSMELGGHRSNTYNGVFLSYSIRPMGKQNNEWYWGMFTLDWENSICIFVQSEFSLRASFLFRSFRPHAPLLFFHKLWFDRGSCVNPLFCWKNILSAKEESRFIDLSIIRGRFWRRLLDELGCCFWIRSWLC